MKAATAKTKKTENERKARFFVEIDAELKQVAAKVDDQCDRVDYRVHSPIGSLTFTLFRNDGCLYSRWDQEDIAIAREHFSNIKENLPLWKYQSRL